MKKLRVMTVVGTRPEIIRLSRVIVELDKYCEQILVHTGQNYDYELNQIFFTELELRQPNYFLNCASNSRSAANTIGNIIASIDEVLEKEKPDAMLVLGDTNSGLSVLPAKRLKVPTFHMEAGNRCFDQRVPEEINRRIIDHTADINLCYSDIAREYLLREGLPPDQIIKTGSPMYEVLHHYLPKIQESKVLTRLTLTQGKYFIVSIHREENIDSNQSFAKIAVLLNSLADNYEYPIIVSTHPRTKKRIDEMKPDFSPLIKFQKPLGFFDYVKLQLHAAATLSDSGTINEEASILKFRALNLREAHERPEGMEEAGVMMVGLNVETVMQGLTILDMQNNLPQKHTYPVADYNIKNVSHKIIRIIHSYTDYVNRVTWKRY